MSDNAKEMIEATLVGRGCLVATHPNEETWLAARRKGIGGSDAAAITGESRFATKLNVWAAKLNTLPPIEQSEAMYAGSVLENSIAIWASEFLDLELVDLGEYTIIHGPQSIAFATLDRVMVTTDDRPPGICEIKNVGEWGKGDWEDGAPDAYVTQVIHQMMVTGFHWGGIAALIGGNKFRWVPVEWDEKRADALLIKEEQFWADVMDEIEPDAVAKKDDSLRTHLHPPVEGKTISLPDKLLRVDASLLKMKAQYKKLDGRIEAANAEMKDAIGDAEEGVLSSGASYTYKNVEKKAYPVKASISRRLTRKA